MQHDKNREHGSPWDRGKADSYYGRKAMPHYYKVNRDAEKIYEKVEIKDMDEYEISEYYAGYDFNEMTGDRKDWG